MKRMLMIAMWILAGAAFGGVIYENDFATRTSAGVVPMTEWRTCDYVADFIANTNGATPIAVATNDVQKMQDGWIKTADSTTDALVWRGTTGTADSAVVLGLAGTGGNKATCLLKQRIGNTFTNGTVTIQFDFQPPANWGDTTSLTLRAMCSVERPCLLAMRTSFPHLFRNRKSTSIPLGA